MCFRTKMKLEKPPPIDGTIYGGLRNKRQCETKIIPEGDTNCDDGE